MKRREVDFITYEEKYNYWVMLADYDFETAGILMKAERWMNVASVCYASVLRLIKGTIVYQTKKEAPKSENLTFLTNKLADNAEFMQSEAGKRFSAEKNKYLDMIIDIMYYHVSDYPFSYQKVMDRFIGGDTAAEVYEKTKSVSAWLKSFQCC